MVKKLIVEGVLSDYKWSHPFVEGGIMFKVIDTSDGWIKKQYLISIHPKSDAVFMQHLEKIFGRDLAGLKMTLVLER